MSERRLGDMSDRELLDEAKALGSHAITNAVMIGFLVGIILFGVGSLLVGVMNGASMGYGVFAVLMLIPLFLIRRFANDPRSKRASAVNGEIRNRGLKR